jgi:hypothetical protein
LSAANFPSALVVDPGYQQLQSIRLILYDKYSPHDVTRSVSSHRAERANSD